MKRNLFILSVFILSGLGLLNAQENRVKLALPEHKHELRLSVSDGLPRTMSEVLGIGIGDAITGTKRSDAVSWGVYTLGYRYLLNNRIRVGSDFSFTSSTSKLTFLNATKPAFKERNLSLMVLPVFEYIYYKKGLIELYGSAAAGVDFTRTSYKRMEGGIGTPNMKSALATSFAWQVNPIAVRVGNNRIGGFLEAGLGHKGFLTAGVSVKF